MAGARWLSGVLAGSLALAGCSGDPAGTRVQPPTGQATATAATTPATTQATTPATTPGAAVATEVDGSGGVIEACQPWPDRPFELLLGAYASRNPQRFDAVAGEATILDPVALAYAGTSDFEDAASWARAGWKVGDELVMAGYNPGFDRIAHGDITEPIEGTATALVYASRKNEVLAAAGIDELGTTYAIDIDRDCHVRRITAVGDVWSQPQACTFALDFLDEAQRQRWAPGCDDGTRVAARTGHHAAWSGGQVVVLGGGLGGHGGGDPARRDGLRYDPGEQAWSSLAWPEATLQSVAGLWATGAGLIGLGHVAGEEVARPQVLQWVPDVGWSTLAPRPAELPPATTGVWADDRLVLWGGYRDVVNTDEPPVIYDPAADRWSTGAAAPFGRRWWHTAVWTGSEMLVWGGGDARHDLSTGAAYDPVADRWRELPQAPIAPRIWHSAVWTGTEMIVWGGSSISTSQADGAAYDPESDSWRVLAPAPLSTRHHHTAVWTGTEMIVWGGTDYGEGLGDGSAYDPATDSWRGLAEAPLAGRAGHTATWTGEVMVVFGGDPRDDTPAAAFGDGAAYDPDRDRWEMLPLPPASPGS